MARGVSPQQPARILQRRLFFFVFFSCVDIDFPPWPCIGQNINGENWNLSVHIYIVYVWIWDKFICAHVYYICMNMGQVWSTHCIYEYGSTLNVSIWAHYTYEYGTTLNIWIYFVYVYEYGTTLKYTCIFIYRYATSLKCVRTNAYSIHGYVHIHILYWAEHNRRQLWNVSIHIHYICPAPVHIHTHDTYHTCVYSHNLLGRT